MQIGGPCDPNCSSKLILLLETKKKTDIRAHANDSIQPTTGVAFYIIKKNNNRGR
jgi:hypothetical protein